MLVTANTRIAPEPSIVSPGAPEPSIVTLRRVAGDDIRRRAVGGWSDPGRWRQRDRRVVRQVEGDRYVTVIVAIGLSDRIPQRAGLGGVVISVRHDIGDGRHVGELIRG